MSSRMTKPQTARDKFRVGQRVRSTQRAIDNGVFTEPHTGVVTAFGRTSNLMVIVRRDDRQRAVRYHMDFWEPALRLGKDGE
jgi:hypothetical protein